MKLINHRPLLFVAISLALGLLLATTILFGQWWLLVAVVVVALGLFIYSFTVKRKDLTVLFSILLAFVLLGFGLFEVELGKANNREIDCQCQFEGVLTDDVYQKGNYYLVVLRDFKAWQDGEEIAVDGKVKMVLWLSQYRDEEGNLTLDLSVGNVVTGVGQLTDDYLFKDAIDTFSYRDQTYYQLNASNVSVAQGRPTFGESARLYIKNQLAKFMPNNNGVAYALLVGDKSLVDSQLLDAFKSTGIVHLLAVSGLHVGFIVTILAFVFKTLKCPNWLNFILTFAILLVYGSICSFTPSVTRAIVMCVSVFICNFTLRKVDLISSLSLAVIVILAVRPLYLFDGGFLMSVSAVFGIATLTALLNRLYANKIKFKPLKWLANSFNASLGATVGTVGWVAKFYGSTPILGVFFNLVAVPVVGFCFVLVAIGLIPFLGFLLTFCDYVFGGVVAVANWLASANLTLTFVAPMVAIILLGVWLFIVGGFVNIKKFNKIVTVGLALIIVAICTISTIFNQKINKNMQICVLDSQGEGAFVVAVEKDFYLVCDFDGYNDDEIVGDYLDDFKDFNLHLCFSDLAKVDKDSLKNFLSQYKVDTAYLLGFGQKEEIRQLLLDFNLSPIQVPQGQSVGQNCSISAVFDGSLVAIKIEVLNTTFLAVKTDSLYLAESITQAIDCDVIYTHVGAREIALQTKIPVFTTQRVDFPNIYCTNRVGEWTLVIKSDKIIVKL